MKFNKEQMRFPLNIIYNAIGVINFIDIFSFIFFS